MRSKSDNPCVLLLTELCLWCQVRLALLKYRMGGLWPVAGKGTREHLARVAGEAPPLEPPRRPVEQLAAPAPVSAQPDRCFTLQHHQCLA